MADLNALKAGLESVKALVGDDKTEPNTNLSPEQRQRALQAELDQVKSVNQVIRKVTGAVDKASSDVNTMAVATANANQLLDLWVRVLSQTEHNYRLLSNKHWQGATGEQKLIAEREAEKSRRKELERLEQERRRQQADIRLRREKESAEKKKAQQDLMQKRIYGRTGVATKNPSRVGTTRPVASGRVPAPSSSTRRFQT
jgi:septal ring factor EnvC (AmiA/AmiB activator)